MINTESYMNVLEKFKISQAQFLMLYCIHFKKWDIIKRYKILFPSTDGSMIGEVQKDNLVFKRVDIVQFRLRYNLTILNDASEHDEVLKDLHYMINNNLIDCNILDFVKSKSWANYRQKRVKSEKMT